MNYSSDCPVYALLPKGTELWDLINSEADLATYLGNASANSPERLSLRFTPEMYARFMQDTSAMYGTLANYGIQSDGYNYFDKGYTVIFNNCGYMNSVSFCQSESGLVVSGLSDQLTEPFIMYTDESTMQYCIADNWRHFNNALAIHGLLPGSYNMTYYTEGCYCMINDPVWTNCDTIYTEDALKSFFAKARTNGLSSFTAVIEISYYDTLIGTDCSGLLAVMSDCRVYGSFSYYDSGVITFSDITY